MRDPRATDRRVRRTRNLLHQALASLIHEKPYDAIVVKEILARADVGRSTFYTHFRDKDELLASGMRWMLQAGRQPVPRGNDGRAAWVLRFSLPLLEHIGRHAASAPGVGTARQAGVHEHLRQALVESLGEDLRRSGRVAPGAVPATLLAEHVAATFVLVLDHWISGGMSHPAGEADRHFRALVLPVLAAALGERMPQLR